MNNYVLLVVYNMNYKLIPICRNPQEHIEYKVFYFPSGSLSKKHVKNTV